MPLGRYPLGPLQVRLLAIALCALLPVTLLSLFNVLQSAQNVYAGTKQSSIQTVRALMTAVDNELALSISGLQILGSSPRLTDGDTEEFSDTARSAIEEAKSWKSVLLFDPHTKRSLINFGETGGRTAAIADPQSLEAVIRTRQPVIGHIVEREPGEGFVVPVRVPVVRDDALLYVLTADVDPESLRTVLQRQFLPSEFLVAVLDDTGHVVARSRNHMKYLGRARTETLSELVGTSDEGWGTVKNLEGNWIYGAYSRSPTSGWIVAIGMPKNYIDAPVERAYWVLGGGLMLSLILGLLAAYVASLAIRVPLRALRERARAMASGERPALPATSISEIREVADALALAQAERERRLELERAARASAEQASRAKDEFLAMLGHELRNPLGAISAAVAVIENAVQPEHADMRQTVTILRRQTDRLADMVADLLDVERVLAGKVHLKRTVIDLGALLKATVDTMRTNEQLARHHVHVDAAPAWIEADPTRIEQVVENLVVNAVRYTPAGKRIWLAVGAEDDQAVLRVRDEGAGMEPDLLPRVFDLFVQGHRTADRAQGGLGIGLTLVRRLIELHNGTVEVKSAGPGMGSEFTVRLPRVAAPAQPAPAPPAASAGGAAPKRVLLVEDNDDARAMLKALLALSGHTIAEAHDGPSGVAAALDAHPDVALIDIGLPGYDGYEVARRIRANLGRGIRLVALTGYGLPHDTERAIDAGFDLHVVKPVDETVLGRILSESP